MKTNLPVAHDRRPDEKRLEEALQLDAIQSATQHKESADIEHWARQHFSGTRELIIETRIRLEILDIALGQRANEQLGDADFNQLLFTLQTNDGRHAFWRTHRRQYPVNLVAKTLDPICEVETDLSCV